jgi:hypothetical protein
VSGGRGGSEKNFPGFGDREPLSIPGDTFTLYFHSDSSNTVSTLNRHELTLTVTYRNGATVSSLLTLLY